MIVKNILSVALILASLGSLTDLSAIAITTAMSKTTEDCSLKFQRAVLVNENIETIDGLQGKIIELIENGDRLIRYDLTVSDDNGPFSKERADETMLLKPYRLILALDDTGKALLNLKDYFVPLSLYTLGYGVNEIVVELTQSPPNCLLNVSATDLETYLRLLILRNFENTTSANALNKEVCNKVIRRTESNTGKIKYSCCKLGFDDKFECNDLDRNIWIYMVLTIITVLQVVFVLYSPTFVPKKKRLSTKFLDYIHTPTTPLKLNILVVNENEVILDDIFIRAKQFPFIEMNKLKERLNVVARNVLYTLSVSQVYLTVRASKIFPGGYSPVGFVTFLKNFFVRCSMRNTIPAFKNCCKTNMFKSSKYWTVPWYKLLSSMMKLVIAGILTLPWILRLLFFYIFEEDLVEQEIRTFQRNGIERPHPASLVLYLTPNHAVFIVIYTVLLAAIALLILLPPVARRKLKFTLRMSLANMTKASKFDSFVLFLAHMLFPFEEYGIWGCLVVIPFWLLAMPVGLLVLCYLIFPVVNLTVRLLVNLIYYTVKFCKPGLRRSCNIRNDIISRTLDVIRDWSKDAIVVNKFERKTRRNMMIHVISLTLCMLTIALLLILVVECIAFYTECAVYIVIGIILNSNKIMKFLSLFVLITWYGFDCFGSVSTRYENFAKVINTEIQDRVGDVAKTVAMCSQDEQIDQAFSVPSKHMTAEERMDVVAGSEGYMKWNAKRLLLFLDKADIPHIPKDFLFKAAKLGHFYCPGPVHVLYLNAFVELVWITLFLGFVMLVILAFGEANDISGANQTLATLASGFLPFAFRKCFTKSHTGPAIDKSNITWKATLAEKIENYSKRFTFSDVDIMPCTPDERLAVANTAASVLSRHAQIFDLNRDTLEQVDIVVKIKGDSKERMEFWVRKAKPDKPKANYIWKSRNVKKQAATEKREEVREIKKTTPRKYIFRSRQIGKSEDVESHTMVKPPIIHIPNNLAANRDSNRTPNLY